MKLIIDIDENVFTRLFENGVEDYAIVNDDLFAIAKSIRKGIPLPKGHGRLIDADALKLECYSVVDPKGIYNELKIIEDYYIDDAPTIIEADKERINDEEN